MSVIVFPENFIVHYCTMAMTGIATIIFIGLTRPFKSRTRNTVELLEEVAIIVLSYHCFCFTDWIIDLEVRHSLGYSLIVCIGLHLFLFIAATMVVSVKDCIGSCR